MDLLIIRHAESANNRIAENQDYDTFVATRTFDPPITEIGEEQAERLACHLAESAHPEFNRKDHPYPRGYRITRLACSPMLRTLQTATPASRTLALPLEVWDDIHEQGGLFDGDPRVEGGVRTYPGMTRIEMKRRFPHAILPASITEQGWWLRGYEEMEESEERAGRVADRLRALAAVEPETRLAIVTHGTFVNQLLHQLLGVPSNSMMYFSHVNTGITRIEFATDGFNVLRYTNRVPHLDAPLMTR